MITEPVVHVGYGTTFDSGRGDYSVTAIVTLRFTKTGKAQRLVDAELAIEHARKELQQKVKDYVKCNACL